MNTEFVKIDNQIIPKPAGFDYDLENGKVYNLNWDDYKGPKMLIAENGLSLPEKIYHSKKDELFIKRILTYYKNSSNDTTGIMLAGTKGTGKTVCSKLIAKESNLPIIVVSSNFPARELERFFSTFKKTEICIILDEVEKNYNTNHLLGFLDGIQITSKKLVLMTCNSINKVSEYMQDRCSRIRYLRTYSADENIDTIQTIIKDKGIEDTNRELELYIKNHIELLSIDNIISFINEYLLFKDELSLDDIVTDMNITKCDRGLKNNEEEVVITKPDDDREKAIDALAKVHNTKPSVIEYMISSEVENYKVFCEEHSEARSEMCC